MEKQKQFLLSAILCAASIVISIALVEGVLRVKNSTMTNYDIEMWRYAKELKVKSADPAIDFEHVPNKSAVLQQVPIRLNDLGLRGPSLQEPKPGERRILFLGGSIALGWGVPEEQTVEMQLQARMNAAGQPAQVLNAGIGNFNAERYVTRFFKQLTEVKPTDIVVLYFLRDAENLLPGGGNFLLRHSQLAVTLWIAFHRLFDKSGAESLVDHYRGVYTPDAPGFITMQQQLKKLAAFSKERGIRLYFVMTPDVHNLTAYPFGFIHDMMRKIAETDGYVFVDLLPSMTGLRPEDIWAMPGDPHPNALGHRRMADAILPVLLASPK